MKKYALIVLTIGIISACKSHRTADHQKVQARLDSVEIAFKKNLMDYNLFLRTAVALEKYSHEYPEDTLSAQYELRSAQIYVTINKFNECIDELTDVQTRFPTSRYAPQALFLKAFIYDSQLKDMAKARQYYTEFIQKYPKSPLAATAQASIQNLGKSPEELVKEFEHKNDSLKNTQPSNK